MNNARESAGWYVLMAAVIVQAVKDARSRDVVKSLDALLWLTSDEAAGWLTAVGHSDVSALRLITSGNIRKRWPRSGRPAGRAAPKSDLSSEAQSRRPTNGHSGIIRGID